MLSLRNRPHSETSSDHSGSPYIPVIDGLRGIAILLVLWYHAPFLFRHLSQFSNQQNPWESLGLLWVMSLGGWIGVDLFFVISGFLITLILIRAGRTSGSLFAFWARRALRILPLFVIYLVALVALVALGDPLHILPTFDGWAWYACYVGNIHIALHGWQPLAIMILWSLAIEEQFYLAWPFLVRMYNARYVLLCSGGLIMLAPVVRALVFSEADYPATYVFTVCRVDALAFGALIAVLYSADESRQRLIASCKKLTAPALGIVMITVLVPFSPSFPATRPWFFTLVGYSLVAASFAVLLAASLGIQGPLKRLLTSRILTFLGRRCYGLYLWHVLAAGLTTVMLQRWDVGFYPHIILWLMILVSMASGTWLFFEEPILRLKRFLPYQRSRPAGFVSTFTSTTVRRYAYPEEAP
jgi:peptidoglycan/LPS O-acetylase OafA/YrhL